MKQKVENYIIEQINKILTDDLSAMLIKGHSNNDRPIPYICVDISEFKPFGDLEYSDGLFDVVLNISIADSAHDIDYLIQETRRRSIENAMQDIELESEDFIINYINLEESSDARDENNIGDVLKYGIVLQVL